MLAFVLVYEAANFCKYLLIATRLTHSESFLLARVYCTITCDPYMSTRVYNKYSKLTFPLFVHEKTSICGPYEYIVWYHWKLKLGHPKPSKVTRSEVVANIKIHKFLGEILCSCVNYKWWKSKVKTLTFERQYKPINDFIRILIYSQDFHIVKKVKRS